MVLTVNENGFTIEGKTRAEYDAEIREQAITEFKEAVVAELEALEEERLKMYDWQGQTAIDEAISIVRNGGKE